MPLQASPTLELDAASLQAAVTIGLTLVAAVLYGRYRKAYFAWFTVAFALYVVRLLVIMAFVVTADRAWLYWHQVATGWTALALLWAALQFSRALAFRPAYGLVLTFPVLWSYIAIYVMEHFLWAALPAVGFLSLVTAWTGAVFLSHWRRAHVAAAGFLGASFTLWAVHHLDYPFLRARGAWVPWGYYLDIAFLLLVGTGLLFLVLDDLRGGLRAMMALVGPTGGHGSLADVSNLLARAATLPAATGAAIVGPTGVVQAIGTCGDWHGSPPASVADLVAEVAQAQRPSVRTGAGGRASGARAVAYEAALPIPRETGERQVLVVTGAGRHPFTALDDEFLTALGRQLGAALDAAVLTERLQARSEELARLSVRMIQQHEEERRRISLELHDETAQVFSAVKLQLGVLRERVAGDAARTVDTAVQLVDQGIRSIRNVTEVLRPAVLDDLGLVAALRSLALDFEQTSGIVVALDTSGATGDIPEDADLVLFRAMQEGLSNVMRHAKASRVVARLTVGPGEIALTLRDDGRGLSAPDIDRLQQEGHMGLAGMRERVAALGGRLAIGAAPDRGAELRITIPRAGGARA